MLNFLGVVLFVGLALPFYPVLLQPTLPFQRPSALWAVGCGAIAILIVAYAAAGHFIATAAQSFSSTPPVPLRSEPSGRPSLIHRLRWIGLAAVSSSLMLGVTTYVSTEIAAVPLLWVAALALYLGTFMVAFSAASKWVQPIVEQLLPLTVLLLVLVFVTQTTHPAHLVGPLHVLAFVVLTLVCHQQLAAAKPAAQLTEFYLWISVGGLLGGLFNTIVAPRLFVSIAEYPIAVVLVCLLRVTRHAQVPSALRGLLTIVAAGALTLATGVLAERWSLDAQAWMAMLGVALVVCLSVSRHTTYFAAAVAVMLVAGVLAGPKAGDGLYAERTFFGVYR